MINGVGDYALGVARILRAVHDIGSVFVVCNPHWTGPAEVEGFPTFALRERSASALVSVLQEIQGATNRQSTNAGATTLLLQLSPYGFDTNGAPFWLSRALRDWKAANNDRRIITMFHDLYANGPPWTRAFWVSALQRSAGKRIALLSDVVFTNIERHAAVLSRWDPSKAGMIPVQPTPSMVGEGRVPVPLRQRTPRLVVFGSRKTRETIARDCAADIQRLCVALRLEEVVEIGVPRNHQDDRLFGLKSRCMGVLSANSISEILIDSVAGVVHYPFPFLAKSSIFAAYCAHGMLPICFGPSRWGERTADGLRSGQNFVSTAEIASGLDLVRAENIAARSWSWYSGHGIEILAAAYSAHVSRRAEMSAGFDVS